MIAETIFTSRNATILYPSLLSAFAFALPLLTVNAAHAQTVSDDDGMTFMITLFVVCALIYAFPSIVAFSRSHPNRWLIFAINLTVGGTGFGWLFALIWALGALHRSSTGNHGGESGVNLFANDAVKVEPTIWQTSSPPLLPDDPADELARLKRLFDAGVISEPEFQAMRIGPLRRLLQE